MLENQDLIKDKIYNQIKLIKFKHHKMNQINMNRNKCKNP